MVLETKLSYTIDEAVKATGASRSRLYEAIASRHLQTFKLGRVRLMTRDALEAWIQASQAASVKEYANG